MESKNKTLALGHMKEPNLLKRIPDMVVHKVLSEYIKNKTGKAPEKMQTFSGLLFHTEYGKVFFRDGELEFEASPFHVKKVKSWHEEMKKLLLLFAGKIYVAEVKKVLSELYSIQKEQNMDNGVLILEVAPPDNPTHVMKLAVIPRGQVAVLGQESTGEDMESLAYNLIKFLESKGLVDY